MHIHVGASMAIIMTLGALMAVPGCSGESEPLADDIHTDESISPEKDTSITQDASEDDSSETPAFLDDQRACGDITLADLPICVEFFTRAYNCCLYVAEEQSCTTSIEQQVAALCDDSGSTSKTMACEESLQQYECMNVDPMMICGDGTLKAYPACLQYATKVYRCCLQSSDESTCRSTLPEQLMPVCGSREAPDQACTSLNASFVCQP